MTGQFNWREGLTPSRALGMTPRARDELGCRKTRATRNERLPKNAQGMDGRTRVGERVIPTRVGLTGQNAPAELDAFVSKDQNISLCLIGV